MPCTDTEGWGGEGDRSPCEGCAARARARIWRAWERGGGESTQRSGVESRWGRAALDEVVENPEDLLGIGDDWQARHTSFSSVAADRAARSPSAARAAHARMDQKRVFRIFPPFPPPASLSELQCILQAEDIPWGRLHVWRAGRTRALKNKPQDCVHGASCRMPEWRRSTPFAIMASASKEAP